MDFPSWTRPSAWWLAALLCLNGLDARGQGTQADYDRALRLRQATENKVLRARLQPQWIEGQPRFWYKNQTATNEHAFVLVDAERGGRQAAFDHARLAAALSRALGREVSSARLPVDKLEFLEGGGSLGFTAEGRRWRCRVADYELQEQARATNTGGLRPVQDGPSASTRTGAETYLSFVNRTQRDLRLYWLNLEGGRQLYRTLRPDERHEQHTFAGHVWLVTDTADVALGVVEATEDGGEILLDGTTSPSPPPRARPRRRRPGGEASPDGKWSVVLRDHNLFLRASGTDEEVALSRDGTAEMPYELPVHWAPDSARLVAWRVAKVKERQVTVVESSPKGQLQPKIHTFDYAKPGDPLSRPHPHWFEVAAPQASTVTNELFPNPWSLDQVHWALDGRRFTFLYNQRGHQLLRLIEVDTRSSQARVMIEESSPTFVDYAGKFFLHHLEASQEALWMSERDGWNHLYLYDLQTGQVKNPVTRGPWVVRDVEHVDAEKRQVWFHAGGIRPGQDPYYLHLCRVNLDGTGLVVLTEADGAHTVSFSPDRRYFVDTWSRVDHPPVHELRRAADGGLVCALERADWSALLATGWQPPERFVAKARDGQSDIYGILHRPSRIEPGRQYPVLEEIYAGPQGASVPKAFGVHPRQHALAELGFVVVQIDGLGTSYRSKAFHDVCWKNLGDAGFPDRILWMKAAAGRYPYLDLSRVGIYGGSAGGQNALRALLAHGDFYKAAAADCGCHDNRMDKIWWNELWMGWPIGPHYEEQSNATQAHRLQGKLLLTVGELDRNVDPASTMQVVNALIKADKDFELLIVPGAGHGVGESPYASRRRMDFFVRHLLGVEPRHP